jgi:hypothetical protein
MSSFNFDDTLANLLTRATLRVTWAKFLPFIQFTIDWAGDGLAVSFLNLTTFAIGTTMIFFNLDLAHAFGLTRSTILGAFAPSTPETPCTINRAGINITFGKLHQRSVTNLAIV